MPLESNKNVCAFFFCYKSNEAHKGLLNNSVQDQNPWFATYICWQWSEEKVCVQRCWLCGPWGRMFVYKWQNGSYSQAPRAGPAFSGPQYLCPGDLEGGVQVGLLEQKACRFLHLGRPDAGIQGCFGDGDIRWVSSFSLWNGF